MIEKNFKRGVAMVELIFAMVVIGIVLLSSPMLIQQSINSSYVALQQEAIAATASHTGVLLSKHWDEGDANHTVGVAPIISITRDPFNLDGLKDNAGNAIGSVRTSNLIEEINASSIGKDLNEDNRSSFDDIDDYHNESFGITLFSDDETTTISVGDYVDNDVNITTSITFAEDRPDGNTVLAGTTVDSGNRIFNSDLGATATNVKRIQVNLTSNSDTPELNKSITLHAFSCNLGTYTIDGRQY
ncbi:MAG: hypothetical protein K0U38_11645 [Epsilonproteobacteria bacterium]|nr:hypothetical protein [Campylobacterota bacterium]